VREGEEMKKIGSKKGRLGWKTEDRLRRKGQIKGRGSWNFQEVSFEGGFLHFLGVLKERLS
jgi:hypothetical protein